MPHVWNQLSHCALMISVCALRLLCVSGGVCVHRGVCISTCFWVFMWANEPRVPRPRWLRLIAPYRVACQLISLRVREKSGEKQIAPTPDAPSLSLSISLMTLMSVLSTAGPCIHVYMSLWDSNIHARDSRTWSCMAARAFSGLCFILHSEEMPLE